VTNAVVEAYLKADAEWSDGMSRHLIKNLEFYQKDLQSLVEDKQKGWLDLAAKGNIDPNGVSKDRGQAASPSFTSVTIEVYQRVRGHLFQTDLALVEAEALLASQRESTLGFGAGGGPGGRMRSSRRSAPTPKPSRSASNSNCSKSTARRSAGWPGTRTIPRSWRSRSRSIV